MIISTNWKKTLDSNINAKKRKYWTYFYMFVYVNSVYALLLNYDIETNIVGFLLGNVYRKLKTRNLTQKLV